MEEKKLPVYESPKVVTYTDEELLEQLGPAQTGYVRGDCAFQRPIQMYRIFNLPTKHAKMTNLLLFLFACFVGLFLVAWIAGSAATTEKESTGEYIKV